MQRNGAATTVARAAARARTELSNLTRHLMQAREREQAALAKTLEDLCQRMIALTVQLHTLRDAGDRAEVANIGGELAALVGEIAMVSEPVHQRLQLLGLSVTAQLFCKDLSARHGVTIHCQEKGIRSDLPPDVALVLFRVLQEATLNAVLHSAAPEIQVTLHGTAADIRLSVVDRGVGFDTERAFAGGGVGLVAIRERIELVHGSSAIVSRPGEGTLVDVRVPLQRDGESR